MKRNLFKKLAAAAGAAVMALTLVMPMGAVQAAGTGSVTITKYVGTNNGYEDLETHYGAAQTVEGEKLNNVKFAYVEVGSRVQADVDNAGKMQTEVLYTVDEELVTVLGLREDNKVTVGDKTYYRQSVLNSAIKSESVKNAVIDYVKNSDLKTEHATEIDGSWKFSDLALDKLYLFAETDASGATKVSDGSAVEVTKTSVPFFVSLPFTGEDGTEVTDIYAYPKNSTGTVDINKKIASVNSTPVNDTKANANIGDVINYEVSFRVPVPEKGLSALKVVDTMDKGLTFDNSADAITIRRTTSGHEADLVRDTDYAVTPVGGKGSATTITIDFASYLDKLTANSTESFTITYRATLNDDAVLGQGANKNKVELQWTNQGEPAHEPEPGNETKVFTYGIDLLKTGEENAVLANVEFELTDGTGAPVNVAKGDNSYYTPDKIGSSNKVVTDSEGKINIRGLVPGTYTLTETKTHTGYVLLKNPVTIVIKQESAETGAATATVNGKAVTMEKDELNESSLTAKVPLNVVNSKGFDLPQTGAAGTAIFAIAGIVLVAVAGALLIFRRKAQK